MGTVERLNEMSYSQMRSGCTDWSEGYKRKHAVMTSMRNIPAPADQVIGLIQKETLPEEFGIPSKGTLMGNRVAGLQSASESMKATNVAARLVPESVSSTHPV